MPALTAPSAVRTRATPPLLTPAQAHRLAVVLVTGLLFLTGLNGPLLEPDEARYAAIPMIMVQSGEWVVPHLEGKPYPDKPPLTYWLVALVYTAFGVQPWAARLVPALASWLTLLLIHGWAQRWLGERTGRLTAWVLGGMGGFLILGRMLLLDPVLTLCVVAAQVTGHAALMRPAGGARLWMLSAAICGLGVLAKGPVAVVLVVPGLLALRWLVPESARCRWFHWVGYGAVVAAVAGPWYLAITWREPAFMMEFVWRHHVRRFLNPYHHGRPWWYYAPALVLELLPWTLALPWCRPAPVEPRERGHLRFAAVAVLWPILFFSLSQAKLPTYLMPALPWLAVLLAQRLAQHPRPERWQRWAVAGAAVTLAGLWFGVPYYAERATVGQTAAALAIEAEQAGAGVVAYRDTWDGAGVYRGRELRSYSCREHAELLAELRGRPRTLVLTRDGQGRAEQLARLLPPDLAVAETVRRGRVEGVWVVRQP